MLLRQSYRFGLLSHDEYFLSGLSYYVDSSRTKKRSLFFLLVMDPQPLDCAPRGAQIELKKHHCLFYICSLPLRLVASAVFDCDETD